jgi:hypothetical protein
MMKFAKLTESTASTFMEYIQRNLPEGVAMKVTKHERRKLPSVIDEHITEQIVQPSNYPPPVAQ